MARTGDWKVARTRRQECLRYIGRYGSEGSTSEDSFRRILSPALSPLVPHGARGKISAVASNCGPGFAQGDQVHGQKIVLQTGGNVRFSMAAPSETLVRIVYNILFTIFFVLSSPYYFLRMWRRGHWQTGFWQRFGVFDAKFKQSITNRHVLWMHAVSVGEVNVCTQLIRALEPRLPNLKIVVSTTTTTGMGELQKKLPVHIGKFYYPIDRKKYVARALATIRPEAVVLVEAEIWPNFILRAPALVI